MDSELRNDRDIGNGLMMLVIRKDTIDQKFNLKQKLEKIEQLTRANKNLEAKLEKLKQRMQIESHPLLTEFCNVRFENLELLQYHLVDYYFRRHEKEKIVQLIIEGAAELLRLGDLRAASILKEYLYVEETKHDKKDDVKEDETSDSTSDHSQQFQKSHEKFTFHTQKPEQDDLSLDLKFLYHKLGKMLHPDMELDESKKEEKNLIMKKITEAYQSSDVHTLLKFVTKYLGLSEIEGRIEMYLEELNKKIKKLKQERLVLTKWGPLAEIYNSLYSPDPAKTDFKLKVQLNRIRGQIRAEEECTLVYEDELILRTYLTNVH